MKNQNKIRSMTGFGKGSVRSDRCSCYCEIKSVNHRYLEVNTKMSDEFAKIELEIKRIVKNQISRGAVYLNLSFVYEEGMDLKINDRLFKKLLTLEREIEAKHGIAQSLNIHYILSYPGVIRQARPDISSAEKKRLVIEALKDALTSLMASRDREGGALQKDLFICLNKIEKNLQIVNLTEKTRENSLSKKMQKEAVRMQHAQSTASLPALASVNEEIVRLTTHIKTLRKLINKGGVVGRELDFLAQEMNREANTISAKALSSKTACFIVQIKAEIEKIREQSLNIE
ncbi:MAG: YicC/YloC family endoribonuclease [Candidatus Kaelpia aquatica]|nr:YicC/YloC family endoribonuclease [Candidatus Kaelpia aquatica]